jgi:hypothetical protein
MTLLSQARFRARTGARTPRAFRATLTNMTRVVEPNRLYRANPYTPSGIRTRATGVKGRRPRPLDDGGLEAE